jgi:hypothetical protein
VRKEELLMKPKHELKQKLEVKHGLHLCQCHSNKSLACMPTILMEINQRLKKMLKSQKFMK